uniref:Genome polyprotein n=1 Tax=Cacopsylla melanoneura TaxID=428564 RepID=A0A8D8TS15_9HEMI
MLTDTPIYMGRDIHKDMPYDITRLNSDCPFYYCLDFSKFDASICHGMVDFAWNFIKDLLVFENEFDYLIYNYCRTLFQNNPIIMPDGRLYIVSAGIPSGSYFTQLIDSIINLQLINMCMYQHCQQMFPIKVLGDDSIFATPESFATFEELHSFFEQFGLSLSDKTVVTRNYLDIVFFGHNFYGSNVTRDEFTCLSLALHIDKEIAGPEETIIRIASLLYDCGFNSFSLMP